MQLLGKMLDKGFISELPSGRTPYDREDLYWGDLKVLFDGAAVGQYLFGQDPLHTNNRRVSGYQNPHHPIDFQRTYWGISNIESQSFITFNFENSSYVIATAHVHSKEIIPNLELDSAFWTRCIDEANRITERHIGEVVVDVIHSGKINFIDRLRIAKKNGLIKTIKRKLFKLVQNKEITG
jgi:hypothetical protein